VLKGDYYLRVQPVYGCEGAGGAPAISKSSSSA
jgi:hypothetical protein